MHDLTKGEFMAAFVPGDYTRKLRLIGVTFLAVGILIRAEVFGTLRGYSSEKLRKEMQYLFCR